MNIILINDADFRTISHRHTCIYFIYIYIYIYDINMKYMYSEYVSRILLGVFLNKIYGGGLLVFLENEFANLNEI